MAPSGGGREHGLLHLIGKDRVGILQEAAAFVQERGGILEEGISHTLNTEAVALLYISGTSEQMDLVERDAPRLGDALELVALFTRIRKPDVVRNQDALPLTGTPPRPARISSMSSARPSGNSMTPTLV